MLKIHAICDLTRMFWNAGADSAKLAKEKEADRRLRRRRSKNGGQKTRRASNKQVNGLRKSIASEVGVLFFIDPRARHAAADAETFS